MREPGFAAEARGFGDDLVALRRELHACAEVGLELPRTQAVIVRELEVLGLTVRTGRGLSSVTAVIAGGRPGPTILLRSDMDALPITEATELPFASPGGAMHACGHDLHMAGLVGAARLLTAHADELAGTVILMFQPGEEGYAGGRLMIEEGVLDAGAERPVAAYALHVDCVTDPGALVTRSGSMMAGVAALHVTVRGTGGHAAFPQHAVDPVPVAADLIHAVQIFAARRVPATDPAVLSITRIASDSAAGNVLAGSVDLEINIRALSHETMSLVREQLPRVLQGIGAAQSCEVETRFVESYPVTYNDPGETAFVLEVLDGLPDDPEVVRLEAPSMASEDFSYVLQEVPGTLVFYGVGVAGERSPMHADRAVFDDSHLARHAAVFAEIAWRRLLR